MLGGAVSPANPGYGATELAYQLKDAGVIALITSSSLLSTALKAIQDVPAIPLKRVYLIDGDNHSSHKTVEQLIRLGRQVETPLSPLKLKPGEAKTRLALICYSSGTTGLPKGVMISHYNVMANVLQTALLMKEFDDVKRDISLVLLPLYHIYGTFLPRGI
jgi:4-coumarate--CoA ligase